MVTGIPVDASYEFPRTELTAMSSIIAQLMQDIDRLDIHRRNMMEELKVPRDITLFYHERHPELRAAETTPTAEDRLDGSTRQHDTEDTPATLATDVSDKQGNLEDTFTSKKK